MEFLEVIFILLLVYISFKLGFRKINHKIPEIPLPSKNKEYNFEVRANTWFKNIGELK